MGLGALVFFTVFKLATMVLFVFLWKYIAPCHDEHLVELAAVVHRGRSCVVPEPPV
jgi:hypothetical protein